MNNNLLQLKIKSRLNKGASNDYDNFECWQIAEAFNKAQLEYARREAKKAEDTKTNVDDLQKIVKETSLNGVNRLNYYESRVLPKDFLATKRVSAKGEKEGCLKSRIIKVYEGEEANLDDLLRDENKNPNFEWGETFKTHIDNKIRIYTDGFEITEAYLTYYRIPKKVTFDGCVDEYDNITFNQECEFKDDIVELLITDTCIILAGDIENSNQISINANNATRNN